MMRRKDHTFYAVVTGDPEFVNTTFLPQYATGFYNGLEPPIIQYELYVKNTEKLKIRLTLYGYNDDNSLWSELCEKADLFIVCSNGEDLESALNVTNKWIPETEIYNRKFKSILACKTDSRCSDENDQTSDDTEKSQPERWIFSYITSSEEQTGFYTESLDEALLPLVKEAVRLQNKRERCRCCFMCLVLCCLPIMCCCDKIRK